MSYVNYHSHTTRCKHARGTEEEYIKAAIDSGYSLLGFSDHSPWPFADGHESGVRMLPSQLDDYVGTVRTLADRYADRIKVLVGLECEAYEEYFPWLIEQKEKYALDYIILGNHTTDATECLFYSGTGSDEHLHRYTDSVIRAMQTGLFAIFAHPELVFASRPEFDAEAKACAREMVRCAKETGTLIEYNLLGEKYKAAGRFKGLGYPYIGFMETAGEEGCSAIVGVDAHDPESITQTDRIDAARALLLQAGLNVVDRLPHC